MKTLLSSLLLCSVLVCTASEPSKPKPLFGAVVTCFIGKADSQSSCTTIVKPQESAIARSGGMTCGLPGQVSELKWKFVGSESGVDIYEISRRFPADAPQSVTTTKTIRFSGKRVIAFEDQHQVIVFDPPNTATK